MSLFEEQITTITIECGDKQWICNSNKVTWPALVAEFLQGLGGMGYFIGPQEVDAINEATGNHESVNC